MLSISTKITDHIISDGLPISSLLTKLANLPKNIPIGETHAIISRRIKVLI